MPSHVLDDEAGCYSICTGEGIARKAARTLVGVAVGDLADEDWAAGEHKALQPRAVAGLVRPRQHIVVVKCPRDQRLTVHGHHRAACADGHSKFKS